MLSFLTLIPKMSSCSGTHWLDLDNACIRERWSTLTPFTFAVLFTIFFLHGRYTRRRWLRPFMTLAEAETYLPPASVENTEKDLSPTWVPTTLRTLAIIELVAHGAFALHVTIAETDATPFRWFDCATWLFVVALLFKHSVATPIRSVLTIYFVLACSATLSLGGIYYDHYAHHLSLPLKSIRLASLLDLLAIICSFVILGGRPFALPSQRYNPDDIGLRVSPEEFANLWGTISTSWITPLIRIGSKRTLEDSDVWSVTANLQSRPLFVKFQDHYPSLSLLRRLWRAHALDLALNCIGTLVGVVLKYLRPYFLKKILDAISSPSSSSKYTALIYALLMCAATLLRTVVELRHIWYAGRAAACMRSTLVAGIYAKALKRKDMSGDTDFGTDSSENGGESKEVSANTGKIVNLISTDVNKIVNMTTMLMWLYSAPTELIIGTVFLFQLLGPSVLAGLLVLAIVTPLQAYLSKRGVQLQKGTLEARDRRMGVVNELVSSVRFLKFFAWEDLWINKAVKARDQELGWLTKDKINSALFAVLWNFTPILVSSMSFLVHVRLGNELTVGVAFTAVALFVLIREPLNLFPADCTYFLQAKVSLERIALFLQEPEVPLESLNVSASEGEDIVGVRRASFKWNSSDDNRKPANGNIMPSSGSTKEVFELRDIDIEFPSGKLTLITGPTASGKTALLLSLLGEMTKVDSDGTVRLRKGTSLPTQDGWRGGNVSYASQQPWLQHMSIRQNILFGAPFDQARYDAIIDACALRQDLKQFEDGEETEIGAKGINLSGGQKARVALARACYAHSNVVLMDDPLSAVDSHTARHLVEVLFRSEIMEGRTLILVTHHIDLVLPAATYLVQMQEGRIHLQGHVDDLQSQGLVSQMASGEVVSSSQSSNDSGEQGSKESLDEHGEKVVEMAKPARKFVADEERQTGGIKWKTYKSYLNASMYTTWIIIVVLVVLAQVMTVGEKFWIKSWGEAYEGTTGALKRFSIDQISLLAQQEELSQSGYNLPSANTHPLFYVSIYATIGCVAAFFHTSTTIAQYVGGLRASRVLFVDLLNSVVGATMRWHDTTPAGRILNRFSNDVEIVDTTLPDHFTNTNNALTTFIASMITVAVILPWFIPAALVIVYLYWRMAANYLATARDLRRMDANRKSPIYSGFGEMLDGIVTVRAFSAEQRFLDILHTMIDTSTNAFYTYWMTNRWLFFRIDFLNTSVLLAALLLAIFGVADAGIAGITITSALQATESIYWVCRFWALLEVEANSIERVADYLSLPQEPSKIIQSARPPAYWPSTGGRDQALLSVEALDVKYAPDLPLVLKSLSFQLKSRERVGIVGRTGSGKSTLSTSLLRFVDPAGGRIILDGVDISKIGLHDLRSKITFIPQDATLLSGTLRYNLDPFETHTDFECLDVLRRVHLLTQSTPRVSATDVGESSKKEDASTSGEPTDLIHLQSLVTAGGSNFSQGQRQLIAMARALLRRSAVVILDEATSSIDFETDVKIQAAIREEFQESLLITVAHRLRTIIDYDRLIVLENGQIAEIGTPFNLIQKEGGIFNGMCMQSGSFTELLDAAKTQSTLVKP